MTFKGGPGSERRGKTAATYQAARSEAERAEREVQASASAARLSAAAVMRVQSSFSAGVRRRDGGGIDVRRTDSHDPRNDERAARMGRPFVKAFFLLDRPRPVLFLMLPKREWGGGIPREPPDPRRSRCQ